MDDLSRAYEILNVSPTAPAHVIKQGYRKLAKRWHPDLYTPGTPAHAEAAQMMKTVNEAYSLIAHAPLRYRVDKDGSSARAANPVSQNRNAARPSVDRGTTEQQERAVWEHPRSSRMFARFEFWTRFVFGALMGFAGGFYLYARFFAEFPTFAVIPAGIAVVILSGYGAARLGDDFWGLAIRRWRF